MRDFKTAQREFLLKLEMAVYITAAMVASSKHTFTPTKLAYEGHGCQHRHTLRTVLSSKVLRFYYSDADGDSCDEANATPSTSKATMEGKGNSYCPCAKGDPVARTYSKSFKFWVNSKRGFMIMSYNPLAWATRKCASQLKRR